MGVLVVKTLSDRKYALVDKEVPFFFAIRNFKGQEIVSLGELPGYDVEKIAKELDLKANCYEIDQKGIPKYLAGYVTLEEEQLKNLIDHQKSKLLSEIRECTRSVKEINDIMKGFER